MLVVTKLSLRWFLCISMHTLKFHNPLCLFFFTFFFHKKKKKGREKYVVCSICIKKKVLVCEFSINSSNKKSSSMDSCHTFFNVQIHLNFFVCDFMLNFYSTFLISIWQEHFSGVWWECIMLVFSACFTTYLY